MNYISVAYATSNDYEYTLVSLASLVLSSDKDTFFNIFFLVDTNFRDNSKKQIISFCKKYKSKCNILFCYVGDMFDNICLQTDYINKPTFFRLLLPQLLTEDKCIYLDSDTIICTDLYDLYNLSLGNKLIAGVKAPGYHLNEDKENYCTQALLPSIDQYINTGVLVMNLKVMREEGVVEKFLKLLPYNMKSQDQDIINSVCYDRILHLRFEYNVMTALTEYSISDYEKLFLGEDLYISWNNPKIIHYATKNKPWKNFNCIMGDYWWNICKKSDMWNYFYHSMEDEFFIKAVYHTNMNDNTVTTKKVFTEFNILLKKRIVIYGAGNRAIKFIDYMKLRGVKPEYILVSNIRNNPRYLLGIEVKEISDVNNIEKDITIVIATLEKYHIDIMRKLQRYNCGEIVPLCDIVEDIIK